MELNQPLSLLIPEVRSKAEQLLSGGAKIAQYKFGFYRVSFNPNGLDEGLSLHVWLSELPAEKMPHGHAYHLRSKILKGSLTRHLWDVKLDSNGSHQKVEGACYSSGSAQNSEPERVALRIVDSKTFKPGDIYEIPFGQIHTTTVNTFPTITIVEKSSLRDQAHSVHYAPLITGDVELTDFRAFEDVDSEKSRRAILSVLKELSPASSPI